MRLLLYNCETHALELENKVTVLEIENPKMYRGVLYDVFNCESPAQEIAIDDGIDLLKAKDIICITDLFNFTLSDKSLLNKVYKYLDKYISENTFLRLKYDAAFNDFINVINALLMDIDIDFDYSQSNEIKTILSAINLSVDCQDNDLQENILQYIKICSELKLCKVLFLVNAKSIFTKEEILLIYKQSLYYKLPLVLIEAKHSEELLENEQRVDK